MVREVLLLGNPILYEKSSEINKDELPQLQNALTDLHDTLISFKKTHGAGRAIAAPQIGIPKRMIYLFIDKPAVFINPRLFFPDNEMMEVLDDCMSFPGLFVKVMRYKRCAVTYRDMDWHECRLNLEGGLSELMQHEYDHLNGILATMRACDLKSFYLRQNGGSF